MNPVARSSIWNYIMLEMEKKNDMMKDVSLGSAGLCGNEHFY